MRSHEDFSLVMFAQWVTSGVDICECERDKSGKNREKSEPWKTKLN